MKKLILISLLCLLLAILAASPVSRSEAVSLASGWMRNLNQTNAIANVTAVTSPTVESTTDWYLITFAEGGYILVSADDRLIPILGYDLNAAFPINELPDFIRGYFNGYHAEIAAIRNTENTALHPMWTVIRNGDFSSFIPNRPVTPMLTTSWDQDWPYNSMCPTDYAGPGGHVYVGCGATAMAQIMKYYAYPTQGTGSHTYTHPTYGTITANFGATTYNYASMPNILYNTANTAISTLGFHCGVALEMDYGADASGSYATDVRPAFVNYFNYETSAQLVYKHSYTTTVWETMMRTEMDNGRPVFYSGQDTTYGGHAFVLDGYQGTNYFHFNWGWNGYANGYFYVSNLNPSQYAFNSSQNAVIGIQPTVAVSAPSNLVASVDAGDNIFLEWESPVTRALTGFNIYKDGALYASITEPFTTFYFDINPEPGTYSYYVTAVFTQGESSPSNTASVTVYPLPVINFLDGFESFQDLVSDLSPWFTYDLDLQPTMDLDGISLPVEGSAMSFISLDTSEYDPPLTGIDAYEGDNLIMCLPNVVGANNDWFVSPKWNTGTIARLRFWARSAYSEDGLAKLKVGYNLTSPEPSGMTIISGAEPISVAAEWTEFNYTLSDNMHANLFAGIQCLTDNGSLLLVDKFQLWSSYVSNDDDGNTPAAGMNLTAYPNPFNAVTQLNWEQKTAGEAQMNIYDIRGRLVKSFLPNAVNSGVQTLSWDGKDSSGNAVASGIYFCKVTDSRGNSSAQKLVLVK